MTDTENRPDAGTVAVAGLAEPDLYIVCGCKPWCRKVFDEVISAYPGDWLYCDSPASLRGRLTSVGYDDGGLVINDFPEREPRFIFFTHWNWKVPSGITSKYTCVNFHMTDLPYGRGGSPLQNLILRGLTDTVVTAHRMTDRLDEGDMYLKHPLSLHGTAEEIYLRAQYAVADMIKVILEINAANCLVPLHCSGMQHPVFKRRTPAQSEIPIDLERLDQVYDHARMLDADTYPRAYVDVGRFRFEFSGAVRYMDEIRASVVIRERK